MTNDKESSSTLNQEIVSMVREEIGSRFSEVFSLLISSSSTQREVREKLNDLVDSETICVKAKIASSYKGSTIKSFYKEYLLLPILGAELDVRRYSYSNTDKKLVFRDLFRIVTNQEFLMNDKHLFYEVTCASEGVIIEISDRESMPFVRTSTSASLGEINITYSDPKDAHIDRALKFLSIANTEPAKRCIHDLAVNSNIPSNINMKAIKTLIGVVEAAEAINFLQKIILEHSNATVRSFSQDIIAEIGG